MYLINAHLHSMLVKVKMCNDQTENQIKFTQKHLSIYK